MAHMNDAICKHAYHLATGHASSCAGHTDRFRFGFRFEKTVTILRLSSARSRPPANEVRYTLGFRLFRGVAPGKRVTFLRLSGPNWSIFDQLIIGRSQVQVLLGPPSFHKNHAVTAPLLRRRATHLRGPVGQRRIAPQVGPEH